MMSHPEYVDLQRILMKPLEEPADRSHPLLVYVGLVIGFGAGMLAGPLLFWILK